MTTTKTLMLAGLAALSLGVGTAMAQESAGGYIAGPREQMELLAASEHARSSVAQNSETAPQYGASDQTTQTNMPTLQGGDGSGS